MSSLKRISQAIVRVIDWCTGSIALEPCVEETQLIQEARPVDSPMPLDDLKVHLG